jgi:hypothetical protein
MASMRDVPSLEELHELAKRLETECLKPDVTAERVGEGRVLYGLARTFMETCPGAQAKLEKADLLSEDTLARCGYDLFWDLDPESGGLAIVGVRVRHGCEDSVKCGRKSDVESWIRRPVDGVHEFEAPRGASTIPAFPTIMRSESELSKHIATCYEYDPVRGPSVDRRLLITEYECTPCFATLVEVWLSLHDHRMLERLYGLSRGPPRTPRLLPSFEEVVRALCKGEHVVSVPRDRQSRDHPDHLYVEVSGVVSASIPCKSCPQYAASEASLAWVRRQAVKGHVFLVDEPYYASPSLAREALYRMRALVRSLSE